MKQYTHKGYTLIQQTEENHNYMIFDFRGLFLMAVQYKGEILTQAEAEEIIKIFMRDEKKRG